MDNILLEKLEKIVYNSQKIKQKIYDLRNEQNCLNNVTFDKDIDFRFSYRNSGSYSNRTIEFSQKIDKDLREKLINTANSVIEEQINRWEKEYQNIDLDAI